MIEKRVNTWLEDSNNKKSNKTRKKLGKYNKKIPYIVQGEFEGSYDFCEKMYADIEHGNAKACIDYPPMVGTNNGKILIYDIGSIKGENQLRELTRYNKDVVTNYVNEIYRSKDKEFIDILERDYIVKRGLKVQKLGKYYKVH